MDGISSRELTPYLIYICGAPGLRTDGWHWKWEGLCILPVYLLSTYHVD